MEGMIKLLAILVYTVMGILQTVAFLKGIEYWWGWSWYVGIFIALPICYIPILGTIVGIIGAIKALNWSPIFSILLFTWPYIIFIVLMAGVGLSGIFSHLQHPHPKRG